MNDMFSRFKRILLTYFGTVVKLLALSVVVSFGFLSFISEKGVF